MKGPRAQSCLCCRHALTDEPSKLIGLGPNCRKKYLPRDGNAELETAWGWIASADLPKDIVDALWEAGEDVEGILRPLMVHASTNINRNGPRRLVARVAESLGYSKLASRLENCLDPLKVWGTDDPESPVRVLTPYDSSFNKAIRMIPGVAKESEGDRFKCWVLPPEASRFLIRILSLIWPGEEIELVDQHQTGVPTPVPGDDLEKVAKEAIADLGFEIRKEDKLLKVKTPYNKAFVEELKKSIPWGSRKWDQQDKVWAVRPKWRDQVIALIHKHFGVTVTVKG